MSTEPNSLYEGEQAELLLWLIEKHQIEIEYAHTSFRWANNAANNAGVTCCIAKFVAAGAVSERHLSDGEQLRVVKNIGPYLVEMPKVVVRKTRAPISHISEMAYGSMSNDGGHFTISDLRYREAISKCKRNSDVLRIAIGGAEFVRGIVRRVLYVPPGYSLDEEQKEYFSDIFQRVREYRMASSRPATAKLADMPHLYAEPRHVDGKHIFVPQILSENREYITAGLLDEMALGSVDKLDSQIT